MTRWLYRRSARRLIAFGLFALLVANPSIARSVAAQLSELHSDTGTRPASQPFLTENANGPLRWQTCDPIKVLVNPGRLGDAAVTVTRAGLGRISALTGLRFTIVGTTSTIPTANWFRTAASEGEIPPVLIGFVPRDRSDLFPGDSSLAGTVANPIGGENPRLVTGAIAFDEDVFASMAPGFGNGRTQGVLLLHELGHLVGLAHTEGLMHANLGADTPATFSPAVVALFNNLRPDCTNRKAS